MEKIKYLQKLIFNEKVLVKQLEELVGKRVKFEEIQRIFEKLSYKEIQDLLSEIKNSKELFENANKIIKFEKDLKKILDSVYNISIYISSLEINFSKSLDKVYKNKKVCKPIYDFSNIIHKFSKVKDEKIPIVLSEEKIIDLVKMPHLLVAGQTGSGKSVFLNIACLSVITQRSSEVCKLALIDPKRVEFSLYDGIEHLWAPIATKINEIEFLLSNLIDEMEKRYELLKEKRVKNLESYNKEVNEKLPYIVVIIDELADLMLTSDKSVEDKITRLAQLSRAVGIHMILATQKPVVEIMTGLIKANMPGRISFRVASKNDSRVILDDSGAEDLHSKGEMIYKHNDVFEKLQGIFISEEEIKNAIKI